MPILTRKIRPPKKPLFINDVEVRDIESLRENFNVAALADYAFDGSLMKFLRERYYEIEAEKVAALSRNDSDLENKLYEIFKVEPPLDAEEIAWRNERLTKLKNFTSDENILAKVDDVAFNQEDLGDLLDEGVAEIYLCGNKFFIPLKVKNKKYIGIGNAVAVIRSEEPVDFDALNISFENIKFDDAYSQISTYTGKNSCELFRALLNLANNGDAVAMLILSYCYDDFYGYYGNIVEPDRAKSFEWLLKAADAGNIQAVMRVSQKFTERRNPAADQKSLEWLLKAAAAGNPQAMINLARLYSTYHTSKKKDLQKAFEWSLKAAQTGDAEGLYNLADCYREGRGVPKDAKKCFEYELKAAAAGQWYAMDHVISAYIKGETVSEEILRKIFEWRLKYSARGSLKNYVADCYENGIGVPKDKVKAFEWRIKAAESGDCNAMKFVADFYNTGTDFLPQDKQKAFEWYLRYAQYEPYDNDGYKEYKVAKMYCLGEGVAQNFDEALYWCRIAANNGYVKAQELLKNLENYKYGNFNFNNAEMGVTFSSSDNFQNKIFAQTAAKFQSQIKVSVNGSLRIDAKNFSQLESLKIGNCDYLEISAEGVDAEDAVETLIKLVKYDFY